MDRNIIFKFEILKTLKMDPNFMNDRRLANLESFKADLLDYLPFLDKSSGKPVNKYKNCEDQITQISEEKAKALIKHVGGDLKMYTDHAI